MQEFQIRVWNKWNKWTTFINLNKQTFIDFKKKMTTTDVKMNQTLMENGF